MEKENIMKKSYKTLATTLALGMLALGIMTTPVLAEEEKPTADLSVSILSQYIWRGEMFSDDSIVIQPSMTVGYKGFAANFWGNLDTDQDPVIYAEGNTMNWNETDFTLSYDGSLGMVDFGVGYIYYAFGDGTEDTQEIYASASLQTLLTPTLTIYRDIDVGPSTYITFDISHSLPLTEKMALDLGAQVSYYDFDNSSDAADPDDVKKGDPSPGAYSALHTGLVSASMTFPMGEYFTITPEIYYSFPLSSDSDDFLEAFNDNDTDAKVDGDTDFIYGGITVGMSF
jgi:uncharacterized protein (TIGR02001 family)